jgi:transposase
VAEVITDLAQAQTRIATLEAELTRLARENVTLRQQLDLLCQKLFGKKSERVSPDQLRLAFAQLAEELKPRDEPTAMDTGERPGKQHRRSGRPTGRRPLPPQLPRERVEIDVPEAAKRCVCGTLKTRIGEAVSEKLDYGPACVRVIETVRLKYACPRCHDGVTEAPAPPQAVERSLATEGLLAHVVVSKYVDHLPL